MAKKYNCTVHGKPMYRIRAKIGTSLDGKPVYKSFYGDGKLEAERARDEYLERHKYSQSDKTLGQLAHYYTYNIFLHENLSASTIELYERQYRGLLLPNDICISNIADITGSDIQSFINRAAKNTNQSNISALVKYMKLLFKWLHKENYCPNLMYGIVVPRKEEKIKRISTFSEDEIKSIISAENRLKFLFILAFSSGLRLGELLALQYSDISGNVLSVSKQSNEHYAIDSDGYHEFTQVVKAPKSKSSIRTVPLPDNVLVALSEHRTWHEKEQLENGYTTEYIFTTGNGTLLQKSNFRRAWSRHLKRLGIEYRKFHACRATYCTLLCQKGVPLETASKLMGHADISTTAQFYRMVSNDEMTNAADRINDIFSEPSKEVDC